MGLGQNGPGPNGLGRNGLWVKLGRPVWVWVELTQNPVGLGRNGLNPMGQTHWVLDQPYPMVSLNAYDGIELMKFDATYKFTQFISMYFSQIAFCLKSGHSCPKSKMYKNLSRKQEVTSS